MGQRFRVGSACAPYWMGDRALESPHPRGAGCRGGTCSCSESWAGVRKYLFDRQDLKVFNPLDTGMRIRPVGLWPHSGKQSVFRTRFRSALQRYTTLTPETSLNSFLTLIAVNPSSCGCMWQGQATSQPRGIEGSVVRQAQGCCCPQQPSRWLRLLGLVAGWKLREETPPGSPLCAEQGREGHCCYTRWDFWFL